jgi:hypothetical protein
LTISKRIELYHNIPYNKDCCAKISWEMDNMGERIEEIREKLNELVESETDLNKGEVLRLSQELDALIYIYYKNMSV